MTMNLNRIILSNWITSSRTADIIEIKKGVVSKI